MTIHSRISPGAHSPVRLSRRTTLAYGCGLLGAGLYFAFNNFTLPLYLSQFTSNAILIAWLSQTRSFEQAIIQPLVGAASDRTWTRFGRRAPFYLTAMPIVALLLIGNSLIPREPAFLPLAVVAIFAFSLVFNVGIDPYYALLIDVTPPPQRGMQAGIAQIFGFAGFIVLLLVSASFWESHPEWVFAAVAAGLVAGFALAALGVRERHDLLAPHVPASPSPLNRWMRLRFYWRQLARTQPEAAKLLGARALYEFGFNAALPFLTLFFVREIGLKGWPDVVAAVPVLAAFGLNNIQPEGLSQLVAAFLVLMTLLAAIPSGWLGDRFGRKRFLALGLVLVGVFALLAASAQTVPQLLFYLTFLGIGNGMRLVMYGPYLADLIPAERVGEFTGLSASAETIGVFLAAILTGALINLNVFGWGYRTVFVLTGIFVLLGFVAVLFVAPKLPALRRRLPLNLSERANGSLCPRALVPLCLSFFILLPSSFILYPKSCYYHRQDVDTLSERHAQLEEEQCACAALRTYILKLWRWPPSFSWRAARRASARRRKRPHRRLPQPPRGSPRSSPPSRRASTRHPPQSSRAPRPAHRRHALRPYPPPLRHRPPFRPMPPRWCSWPWATRARCRTRCSALRRSR